MVFTGFAVIFIPLVEQKASVDRVSLCYYSYLNYLTFLLCKFYNCVTDFAAQPQFSRGMLSVKRKKGCSSHKNFISGEINSLYLAADD